MDDIADGDENATTGVVVGVSSVATNDNATGAALLLPLLPMEQPALRFETCAVVGNRCESRNRRVTVCQAAR